MGHIPLPTLVLTIARIVEAVVQEGEPQILIETLNGTDLIEELPQALLSKPPKGFQLNIHQAGNRMNLGNLAIRFALRMCAVG